MKPFNLIRLNVVLMLVVLFVFISCAHTIRSADALSQLRWGSPLKGISPKIFIVKEFQDTRDAPKPLRMGGVGVHSFKLDQPPETMVASTIRQELMRNGHTCVDDMPESKADFIIEGSVYKANLRTDTSFFYVRTVGEIAVKLTISTVKPDNQTFTQNYTGEYSTKGMLWNKKVIIQALLVLAREISTDPELIAFLDK